MTRGRKFTCNLLYKFNWNDTNCPKYPY
ncbi:hypothetical protein ACJIZ3_008034 [Penstemon smallii]|uniref:Uncharacterized protein n=1 Tax=Penstemon smallii TaxID=265156 RepID=A0ABD3SJ20_9LAMI